MMKLEVTTADSTTNNNNGAMAWRRCVRGFVSRALIKSCVKNNMMSEIMFISPLFYKNHIFILCFISSSPTELMRIVANQF